MRKLLLAMVAALALVAVALPGTAMAAKGGNAEAARACRADFASFGFKNRGKCVSHVARGGELVAPTAFQALCAAQGGTWVPEHPLAHIAEACAFGSVSGAGDPRILAFLAQPGICPSLTMFNLFDANPPGAGCAA